jgi:hypothetical protein
MTLTQAAQCPLDDAVIGKVLRSNLVLRSRNPEQQHGRNADCADPIDLAVERLIHREVEDLRHGRDLALDSCSVDDEERLDQVRRRELMLAD